MTSLQGFHTEVLIQVITRWVNTTKYIFIHKTLQNLQEIILSRK